MTDDTKPTYVPYGPIDLDHLTPEFDGPGIRYKLDIPGEKGFTPRRASLRRSRLDELMSKPDIWENAPRPSDNDESS